MVLILRIVSLFLNLLSVLLINNWLHARRQSTYSNQHNAKFLDKTASL